MAYIHGHWDGCSCEDCRRIYEEHNGGYEPCECEACVLQNLVMSGQFRAPNGRNVIPSVATVNFCDRCESMGKSHAMGSVEIRTDATRGPIRLEICPGCVAELMAWRDAKGGDRERAYREPWTPPESKSTPNARQELRELVAGILAETDDVEENS